MRIPVRPLRLPGALLTCMTLGAGLATTASADVVDLYWIDADNFGYRITHMPDFDQRRMAADGVPGLPNNGAMYCVPASTMNVFGYIANHGFPNVPPQQNYWSNPDNYDLATGNLFIFGALMNTNPTTGTGWNGWINGVEALLPLDMFTYTLYAASNTYTPRFKQMAQSAFNGSLVQFCHGWYSEVGDEGGVPVITRGGGHCLTLTRAYAGLFSDSIYARDPADDPANTTQSPFMERIYEAENRAVVADGISRVMTNLQTTPGTWSSRYLDGYAAIRPKAGYSFVDIGIIYYAPLNIWDSSPDPEITIEAVAEVTDIVIGPDQNNIYYIGRGGSQYRLYCANIQSRESVEIGINPVTIRPRLTVGRRRDLYHLSGRNLTLVDQEDPVKSTRVTMPSTGEAIAYNDATDKVAILDTDQRLLRLYPFYLGSPVTLELPGAGELPLDEEAVLTWDSFRDAWWVVSDASDDVFMLKRIQTTWFLTRISHPALLSPTSVDVDDAGNVFVMADCLLEFREQGGVFGLYEDSLFADAPFGTIARITKCRTNYDPTIHDGERWRNVLPATFGQPLPDCPADLDRNGTVAFGDILAVLTAWGPCPPDHYCDEDLDFSGATDFGDLLRILTDWGPCP